MQNRYVCDVGDFAKYSVLTALAGRDFSLGVVWYLNLSEESNNDGRFTDYASLRRCNELVYSALEGILRDGARDVGAIEQSRILPEGTRFFAVPLPPTPQRQSWMAQAGAAMQGARIVFLDPDNGLPESPETYSRRPAKYVSWAEVGFFTNRQQTLVIYQHQHRSGTFEEQLERHCRALRTIGLEDIWILTFHRFSSRAFIVIPAERDKTVVEERCRTFIQSAWGREGHFKLRIHKTQPVPSASAATALAVRTGVHPSRPAKSAKNTTQIGYTNRNGQTVVSATGLPGTDHGQSVYVLRCGLCGREYGANGSDIFQRRCPWCQRGKPGLPIR